MATLGERIGITLAFNGGQAFSGIQKVNFALTGLKRLISAIFVGKTINDMARFGKEMYAMSLRTGLSARKLNSLRNAFISAGSDAQGFEKTINNISNGLRGLALGRGDFASKLGMIGVSPYTAEGRIKTADEALYDIADWAKSQEGLMSQEQILYMLRELFGIDEKLGEKLLGGGESFRRLQEESQRRMGTVSDEAVSGLEKLNTGLNELWGSLKNLSANFFGKLAHHLGPVIDLVRTVFVELGKNKDVLEAFGTAIGTLVKLIVSVVGLLGYALGSFASFIGKIIAGIVHWTSRLFFNDSHIGEQYEALNPYRVSEGSSEIDIQRLMDDFNSGKINKGDEVLYYTALRILKNYGGRYQEAWEHESIQNTARMAELGFTPDTSFKTEKLFDEMPTNLEQASISNKDVKLEQNMTFNVTGDMTRETAEETVKMYEHANGDIEYVFINTAQQQQN